MGRLARSAINHHGSQILRYPHSILPHLRRPLLVSEIEQRAPACAVNSLGESQNPLLVQTGSTRSNSRASSSPDGSSFSFAEPIRGTKAIAYADETCHGNSCVAADSRPALGFHGAGALGFHEMP